MNRLKDFKYFTLAMLLCSFVAAGSLSSCRDQKKENAEEQAEHPEGEEHPTEEGATAKDGDEHPAKDGDEHPEGEEHPTKEGEDHPTKDSISG